MNTASAPYAIVIDNLHKDFKLYAHPRQILSELVFGRKIPIFTALDNISFTVGKGEVVGIMGRNGAGKSTLLRILAGTLNPTSGKIQVNGRISAILELGTGFNMEYSGRENIIAGGVCMGMSREEVMNKMDSIIDFSELREFIDQPFKTYSSGMQARLTFATAVAIEPEILIVDEALSVGDARFQAKCFAKIQQFRNAGGSILLVSHSDNVITQFCDRAILLEQGRIVVDASPSTVTNIYCDLLYGKGEASHPHEAEASPDACMSTLPATEGGDSPPNQIEEEHIDRDYRAQLREQALQTLGLMPFVPTGPGHRTGLALKAEVLDICVMDRQGNRKVRLKNGESYRFVMHVIFYENVDKYNIGFTVRSTRGLLVYGVKTFADDYKTMDFPTAKKGVLIRASADIKLYITNGTYFLTANIAEIKNHSNDGIILDGFADAVLLDIESTPKIFTDSIVNLEASFICTKIS